MPIDNRRGIFKDKRALLLATKYNLDLTNKNSYMHTGEYITYRDVNFIVNNLWIDHIMYGVSPPISVDYDTYMKIIDTIRIPF